jgi:hypothetical protein
MCSECLAATADSRHAASKEVEMMAIWEHITILHFFRQNQCYPGQTLFQAPDGVSFRINCTRWQQWTVLCVCV